MSFTDPAWPGEPHMPSMRHSLPPTPWVLCRHLIIDLFLLLRKASRSGSLHLLACAPSMWIMTGDVQRRCPISILQATWTLTSHQRSISMPAPGLRAGCLRTLRCKGCHPTQTPNRSTSQFTRRRIVGYHPTQEASLWSRANLCPSEILFLTSLPSPPTRFRIDLPKVHYRRRFFRIPKSSKIGPALVSLSLHLTTPTMSPA